MPYTELHKTALHEAGHAVIAVLLGKKFRDVSIKANDDFLGRLRYWTDHIATARKHRMIARQNPAWAAEQTAIMNRLQERQKSLPKS